ncbi:MAG: hypothetical protein HY376_02650 [Candidatus Blackburnbacteria bacterium]|nr:hypothetical protein [Candidatus Blackburnbacteria bacterium]
MTVEQKVEGQAPTQLLSPEDASQELYNIWYKFAKAGKTAEAERERQISSKELHTQLSPEARGFLDRPVPGAGEGVETTTVGFDIRVKATIAGYNDLRAERERVRKEKEETERGKTSRGEARAIRRYKANKRRSTKPSLIH